MCTCMCYSIHVMKYFAVLQIFFHPMLRLQLISEEDHCKIFGNIQTILSLHESMPIYLHNILHMYTVQIVVHMLCNHFELALIKALVCARTCTCRSSNVLSL